MQTIIYLLPLEGARKVGIQAYTLVTNAVNGKVKIAGDLSTLKAFSSVQTCEEVL